MADLTYKQLQKAVKALTSDVTKGADAIRARSKQIDEEAKDTARVSDGIGQMGVDSATTAETTELSRLMNGVSQSAIAYASAGDTTAKTAQAASDQAATTHAGIQERVSRSPVDVSNVDREWFRQE